MSIKIPKAARAHELTQSTFDLYMSLCERGLPVKSPPQALDHRPAARALVELALQEGGLRTYGPWRLASEHVHRLEQRTSLSPPGGWAALAGVLMGCDVLHMDHEGIIALTTPEALAQRSAEQLQRQLIEALTVRLVPPTTAAGMFLIMGVHPAWGLRLAYKTHGERDAGEQPLGRDHAQRRLMVDERMFPERQVQVMHRAVFTTLACIIELLRSLPPGKRYPIDELSELVYRACELGRSIIERGVRHPCDGLVPMLVTQLIHHGPGPRRHQRATDFAVTDLIDGFLVPVGAATRHEDHTISLCPAAMDDQVRVGGDGDTLGQTRCLTKLLAEDAEALVA